MFVRVFIAAVAVAVVSQEGCGGKKNPAPAPKPDEPTVVDPIIIEKIVTVQPDVIVPTPIDDEEADEETAVHSQVSQNRLKKTGQLAKLITESKKEQTIAQAKSAITKRITRDTVEDNVALDNYMKSTFKKNMKASGLSAEETQEVEAEILAFRATQEAFIPELKAFVAEKKAAFQAEVKKNLSAFKSNINVMDTVAASFMETVVAELKKDSHTKEQKDEMLMKVQETVVEIMDAEVARVHGKYINTAGRAVAYGATGLASGLATVAVAPFKYTYKGLAAVGSGAGSALGYVQDKLGNWWRDGKPANAPAMTAPVEADKTVNQVARVGLKHKYH